MIQMDASVDVLLVLGLFNVRPYLQVLFDFVTCGCSRCLNRDSLTKVKSSLTLLPCIEKKDMVISYSTFATNNAPLHIYAGHISSLIKADMLDSVMTRLVAVNSIYFKGLWKSCFQPENTKMRPFTGGNGNVYKVPMMSQLSVFNIGE